MNSLKYFYINNQKFNYTLEFQSNHVNDHWKNNAPLIEYCETLGVTIPHYCYHKSLSISGNCRMCLVELKNSPKPIVSCAMSAKSCLNNSEVFTNSPLVKKARENVLEFLLLNHPLDCPICDQGGECDLQDQSLYFGITKKRFYTFKRIVTDKNIGPIVKTVMTRCIHCTRCVRFAAEIAGTEDLGMFGRGLDSEIGTYVTKTFQSELSGNVIDLCPVGALTSKPYPFLSRNWELKNVEALDFSDGFGSNIQVSLKNNQIVKVASDYNPALQTTPWISDKTRFSFDGMFSPERMLKGFLKTSPNNTTIANWKLLLSEIVATLYFHDHLNNHFVKTNKLYIVFSNNINLEVLSLLMLFSNKYSFIKLRKFEKSLSTNDLESEFLTKITTANQAKNLLNSNLCLLLSLNSRYEGSKLNIDLRKRYFKGNFKLLNLGSAINLTFPSFNIGLNVKNLQSIVEGNNLLCQEFISSQNPLIITNSSLFQRKDTNGLVNILKYFKQILTKYHLNWDNLSILNSSINEAGVNYLNTFKSISEKDLNSSCGLYFLTTQHNSLNLQKLIQIKLLKYLDNNSLWPTFCIEQNFGSYSKFSKQLHTPFKIYNYINLPNNSFYESTGSYLNTEGELKKNIKFVSTKAQTKEDWQIIRKIFSSANKINSINTFKNNFIINFNNTTFTKFKSFTSFLFQANDNISNKKILFLNNSIPNKKIDINFKFKEQKSKIFSTKFKIWINDFYLGGNDSYSQYSKTMINCSKTLRSEKNSFSHLI